MFPPYTAVDLVRVMQEGLELRDAQLQAESRKFSESNACAPTGKSFLGTLIGRVQLSLTNAPCEPSPESVAQRLTEFVGN